MSKLIDALKQKYKTPAAALKALGLDEKILKDVMAGDKALAKDCAEDAGPVKRSHGERVELNVNGKHFVAKKWSWGWTLTGVRPYGIDPKSIGAQSNKAALIDKLEQALKTLGKASGDTVGDSKLPALADNAKDNPMKTILMTRKAAMTMGAAIPFLKSKGLAKDAMPDWSKVLAGVTSSNFATKKGTIVAGIKEATKGKLAKDASLEGLVSLLDAVEDEEPDEIDSKDAMETDPNSGVPMEAHTDLEDKSMDDDPHAGLKEYLKGKGMSEDDISEACDTLMASGKDAELGSEKASEEGEDEKEDEEEMKEKKGEDKGAKDEPPPFKGKPKVGGGMDSAAVAKAIKASQQANDAALKAAIKLAKDEANRTREAERFVRPWVGDLAMAHDSAEEVYKTTLTALGKNVDGVHPSAYKAILESMPLPNSKRQANDESLAMDSSASAEFARKWPGVARISHF